MIKVNDRVSIPQEEHPDINFVGLLIGPRGNTLKGEQVACLILAAIPIVHFQDSGKVVESQHSL